MFALFSHPSQHSSNILVIMFLVQPIESVIGDQSWCSTLLDVLLIAPETKNKNKRNIYYITQPFTHFVNSQLRTRQNKKKMNEAEKYNNYWFIIINLNVSARCRDKRHATMKNKKAHIKMSIKWFNILPQRWYSGPLSYMHWLNYTSYIFTFY